MNTTSVFANHRQPKAHEELLGMFLREPSRFGDYELTEQHFLEYGFLYRTMKALHEVDALGVRTLADKHPQFLGVIQDLHGCVVSVRLMDERVREVKDAHLKRQLHETFRNAVDDLDREAEPSEVYRDVVKSLDMLQTSDSGALLHQGKSVDEWYRWVEAVRHDPSLAFGLMTGIKDLDLVTSGFHRHDLSVVGARTSMGKSAFVLEMVLRLQQQGYKCAIFSLEMTRRQIFNRMIANLCRIPLQTLKQGKFTDGQWVQMQEQRKRLESVYVDDTRGVTAEYITDAMRTLKRRDGLDFVVVDYLQDVKEKGEENDNQGSALARICRKLRKGALDNDCHVMTLSQVKRDVENRNDKRPMNSDLSGSTGIETSADVIALLYREEYYVPDTVKEGILEVNFTKQRNGQLGKVELKYDKDIQRIHGKYE